MPVSGWKYDRKKIVPILCIAVVGNDVIAGTQSGKLLHCKGQSIFNFLENHKQRCGAIRARNEGKGFISGSADGLVIVWSADFKVEKQIHLSSMAKELDILDVKIRAVAESYDGRRISIGTRSSDILEGDLETVKFNVVNRGHFKNELWGLAIVPKKDEIITCGEDFVVARWNIATKKLIKRKKVPYLSECCNVSPDGKHVAIGCINGKVLIWTVEEFTEVIKPISHRDKEVLYVKYSPDGKYLAAGSKDCQVIIYSVKDGYEEYGKNKQHKSPINHMDWSADSKILQSNDSMSQLQYFNIDTKDSVVKGLSEYKDVKWHTWTCLSGWPVLGIWAPTSDGTDINSVDRSQAMTTLATGDDFGKVKLFKYPSVIEFSSCNSFSGHSSLVSAVRFSTSQNHLISIGATDKAIFQWKYIKKGEDENKMSMLDQDDLQLDPDSVKTKNISGGEMTNGGMMFQTEDMDGGDQAFGDNRQYKQELEHLKPTTPLNITRENEAPDGNLYPVFTFGFNAQTRCSTDGAKFGDGDRIIFANAALGVSMDIKTRTQRFFNQHRDEIHTFDVSSDKKYCATGSMVPKDGKRDPEIYIWNIETSEEVGCMNDFHRDGIRVLRFSPESRFLLTIGKDKNNCLAVYDWQNQRLVSTSKVDKHPVYDASWSNETTFVTVGRKHIKFWKIKLNCATAVNGIWGDKSAEAQLCCAYADKVCFTGSEKGHINCWDNCINKSGIEAHKGKVTVLRYNTEKKELVSGGSDGIVKIWKVAHGKIDTPHKEIDLSKIKGGREPCSIKSLDIKSDGSILIGTENSEIFISTGGSEPSEVLMGHSGGELWGLACHPTKQYLVTGGGDKTIKMWDVNSRGMIGCIYSDEDCRALDWSSDGKLIIGAFTNGKIRLYNNNLDLVSEETSKFTNSSEWIEEIKFDPTCKMVAFGPHGNNGNVQIMSIVDGSKIKESTIVQVANRAGIIHLDWSMESTYIMVNTDQYQILFIDVRKSAKVTRSIDVRDVLWSTWTSTLGFPVQGIIRTNDPNDVNTVCRANNHKVMATGDDFYHVTLFRYPSTSDKTGNKRFLAHSSLVTKVKFMLNDNCLVSIGGQDRAIIIWGTDFGGEYKDKDKFFKDQNIDLTG